MKIGLITAGDIVAAFDTKDDKEMSPHMLLTYLGFQGANVDTEVRFVEPNAWERLKAALEEMGDIDVQDFTTA